MVVQEIGAIVGLFARVWHQMDVVAFRESDVFAGRNHPIRCLAMMMNEHHAPAILPDIHGKYKTGPW